MCIQSKCMLRTLCEVYRFFIKSLRFFFLLLSKSVREEMFRNGLRKAFLISFLGKHTPCAVCPYGERTQSGGNRKILYNTNDLRNALLTAILEEHRPCAVRAHGKRTRWQGGKGQKVIRHCATSSLRKSLLGRLIRQLVWGMMQCRAHP